VVPQLGRRSLLLSSAPIGGGALTVTAGILRVPLSSFPVLATIDKTARYIVLALAILGLIAS